MMAQKSKQRNDPKVTQVLEELAGAINKALDGAADLSTGVRDLRSIETLLLPRRIPVPMSRVCSSFRRERSALTWVNRVMSSANQPSCSHQSNFRSSAEYASPVWRGSVLPL
jgi:hypothetical protein